MMTFDLANAGWMYLLGAAIVLFVLTSSIIFIVKSYRDAKKIGMDPDVIRRTIVTSALFTLIPSVSILLGVISLSGIIGVPLPWIRLTVIGALHYEAAAIDAAYNNITMDAMTIQQFVTIAWVMTLGILSGPLYCLFSFKSYDKKVLSKTRANPDEPAAENGEKKRSFGPILFAGAFIAMICSFLAEDIAKLKFIGKADALGSYTPAIVIVVAFGSMALCDLLSKKLKWHWLDNFALGLSMIVGMAAAALIG